MMITSSWDLWLSPFAFHDIMHKNELDILHRYDLLFFVKWIYSPLIGDHNSVAKPIWFWLIMVTKAITNGIVQKILLIAKFVYSIIYLFKKIKMFNFEHHLTSSQPQILVCSTC